jgi:hypothetical protein
MPGKVRGGVAGMGERRPGMAAEAMGRRREAVEDINAVVEAVSVMKIAVAAAGMNAQ